jgi:hypothetical protein
MMQGSLAGCYKCSSERLRTTYKPYGVTNQKTINDILSCENLKYLSYKLVEELPTSPTYYVSKWYLPLELFNQNLT